MREVMYSQSSILVVAGLFLVMLPVAYILTIGSLVRDLGTSLRNIWSRP